MKIRQILLFPFALLYGLIIRIRNLLYASGVFKRHSFNLHTIVVGNLVAGGTGKTPMTEYLINLLSSEYQTAVLSRGYKRKTKGFIETSPETSAVEIGDESAQIKRKFPELIVAVDENRVHGIKELIKKYEDLKVVILDDAFQHRKLKPDFSILITNYGNLYTSDFLLPSGMLREHISNAKSADIIVVHKTPRIFSPIERKSILAEISAHPLQKVLFSYIDYSELLPLFENNAISKQIVAKQVILVTGIANPDPAVEYLKRKYQQVELIRFPDHYSYAQKDMEMISGKYKDLYGRNKIIVITEKDAVKFTPDITEAIKELPVYIMPVKLKFHGSDAGEFEKAIKQFMMLKKYQKA